LRLRPLLPLAAIVVAGCALGLGQAIIGTALLRAALLRSVALPLPVLQLVAVFWLGLILWLCKRRPASRASLLTSVCALCATCALLAAQRSTPPADDISQWVRSNPATSTASRMTAQKRLAVTISGWVADHPQRSDFGIEFPLQCDEVTSTQNKIDTIRTQGRAWMQLPVEAESATAFQVGDAVIAQAELADLPHAGNIGERSRQARYILESCWSMARVRKVEDVRVVQRGTRYALQRHIAALRQRLMTHYETALAAPGDPARGMTEPGTASGVATSQTARPYAHATAQLLVAMVFGEGGLQQSLPRLTRDQFRAAGLSHLLVASGTQVAFLGALLIGTARWLRLRHGWLLLLVVPTLMLYAMLAGGASSIWRATVAGVCVAWALLLGRDTDGVSLWSLSLIILLLIEPMQLHDLGFQLTFAATWGLLVLAPALRPRLERIAGAGWLAQLAALSLGAQLAATPLLLYHFGRMSLVGLGANFIAVPLAAVLVTGGLVGLVVPWANALNYLLVRFMDGVATVAARAPGAQTEAPPLPLLWTIGCYALLVLALLPGQWNQRWNELDASTRLTILRHQFISWWQRKRQTMGFRPQSALVCLALVCTAYSVWRTVASRNAPLRVTVLDVGQGESIVVQSPSGRTVLIDGGTRGDEGRGEVGRSVIVPYLQSMGIQQIDAMVLTHADSDHCNGLPAVLREVPVRLAIDGAAAHDEMLGAPSTRAIDQRDSGAADMGSVADYAAVKRLWCERGVPVHAARAGQKLQLGDGIVLTVVAPLSPPLRGENNNGAVLRLDHGAVSMLLTGDIEREAEERLLRRGAPLQCTVLKVAHHGSKTSTSPQFLRAAAPKVAVLSCGRYNSFGHPNPVTLQRLAEQRVATFRTDIDGAVEILSDGRTCWVQTFR
jgi:competence protein ComEC